MSAEVAFSYITPWMVVALVALVGLRHRDGDHRTRWLGGVREVLDLRANEVANGEGQGRHLLWPYHQSR